MNMKYAFKFTVINSLLSYKIKSAYAGYKHSLFITSNGSVLSCGINLKSCVLGHLKSCVFIGSYIPPMMPNRTISDINESAEFKRIKKSKRKDLKADDKEENKSSDDIKIISDNRKHSEIKDIDTLESKISKLKNKNEMHIKKEKELKEKLKDQEKVAEENQELKAKLQSQEMIVKENQKLKQKIKEQEMIVKENQELKAKLKSQEMIVKENQKLKQKIKEQEMIAKENQELKAKLKSQEMIAKENQELKAKLKSQEMIAKENQELKEKLKSQEMIAKENQELKEKLKSQEMAVKKNEDLKAKLKNQEILISKQNQELEKLKEKYNSEHKKLKDLMKMQDQNTSCFNSDKPKEINLMKTLQILDVPTIENLEKTKTIYQGSSSTVVKVIRREPYALKILNVDKSTNDDDDNTDENKNKVNFDKFKKFIQESEILNLLNHPNIIKTFGVCFGDDNHEPSILLEFYPTNLKKNVKNLDNETKAQVIIEICNAMKHVHSNNIMHRDLRPENILLTDKNQVKIGDFGFSTLISDYGESISHSKITNKLRFNAPELLQGRTDYNEKIDVYAFGIVVHFILLNGEYPKFSFNEVIKGKKVQLTSKLSQFSQKLICACLSPIPSDRPSFSEIYNNIMKNRNKFF